MEIVATHFDRDGNVKGRYSQPCDSFNYNFMRFLACSVAGSAVVAVIDTANTSRSINFAGIANVIVASGISTAGIRVGSNQTASAPGDYNLGAMITHGMADGSLVYGGQGQPNVTVVGTLVKMSLKRVFINAGSVSVSIKELDLVTNQGGYNVQLLRDAIPEQVVPSLDGITIEIIIQITV
jgi:hypothetical protein